MYPICSPLQKLETHWKTHLRFSLSFNFGDEYDETNKNINYTLIQIQFFLNLDFFSSKSNMNSNKYEGNSNRN
jgi:hypothetical protein